MSPIRAHSSNQALSSPTLSLQRAADAVDLVDLGAAPGRGGQAQQQPHRPAVVGREIDESRIVFSVAHVSSLMRALRASSMPPAMSGTSSLRNARIVLRDATAMLRRPRRIRPCSTMLDKVANPTGPRLDLQQHLADLEAAGLLVRIDRPINKDTELIPLVRWQFIGGMPEDQRRAFLFTNVIDSKGRNTTCRWWSARWPRRRRSTRSAWAGRSRRSARPGWRRSRIRSRRSPPTMRRARRSSSPATR